MGFREVVPSQDLNDLRFDGLDGGFPVLREEVVRVLNP